MKYGGPSDGSQQSGGNVFFVKYGGLSDGSPLSGGGIIILRVIRRHFLARSEEHTSELQSLASISYAVFCLKKKNKMIRPLTAGTHQLHLRMQGSA